MGDRKIINDMSISYTRLNFYFSEFIIELKRFRMLAMRLREYYPHTSEYNIQIDKELSDISNLAYVNDDAYQFISTRLSAFNKLVAKLVKFP